MTEKRAKNFTNFEKDLLVDLILQSKDIIESKRADATATAQKKKRWEDITQLFNNSNQTGERNLKQLKELYTVIKKKAKGNYKEDTIGLAEAEGGTYSSKSDASGSNILDAPRNQFQSSENPFHINAILTEELSTCDVNQVDGSVEYVLDGDAVDLEEDVTSANVFAYENDMPATSHGNSISGSKRNFHHMEVIDNSFAERKKAKVAADNEFAAKYMFNSDAENAIKKRELQMQETEHRKRCEILDIEKKIKLKELEIADFESKIKELEYKVQVQQCLGNID